MAYPVKNAQRYGDNTLSTLPLIIYLALAVALMVVDQRSAYGVSIRRGLAVAAEPFWWVVSTPSTVFRATRKALTLHSQLQADNDRLRTELAVASARIHRLNAVNDENLRLRQLLGGTRGYRLNVRRVGILDVDLDPYRQRLVLDAGSSSGVRVGQALIDAGGVLGQVVEVSAKHAIALLLTDADHAVPVQVARSGLRTMALGTGRSDRLSLPNIPQSADIREGDVLMTSGIGGHFPAGFPVGIVTQLHPDNTRLFMVAEAKPAAYLDRGIEALLVGNLPPVLDAGPPAPGIAPATESEIQP